MSQTLLTLAVIIIAGLVYWPILKMARVTIAERSAAGQSNSLLYAVLLFPLIGPFLFLLFRSRFRVRS